MKILFKNNTRYTKDKYNDFLEFHKNKYGKKVIAKMLIIALCLLYILIFNIVSKNWLAVLIFIAIGVGLYLLDNLKVNKETSKNKKMIKKQSDFTFFFYEKYIKIRCGRKFDRLRYFELHKVFETNDYFFLYTDETHSLIISKDGFEIGTPRGFSEFIKKKCILKYRKEK